MKKDIKIWRKQVLKSQGPSFFMVNQSWVDDNHKFCEKNGLRIEYPEVEEQKEIEKFIDIRPKKKAVPKLEISKSEDYEQINEIENEETK